MYTTDRKILQENTKKYITWQEENWNKNNTDKIYLNLGSGNSHLKGYVNIDLYSPNADLKADFRKLDYDENSIGGILSSHSLEHIPLRDIEPTLKEWYKILSPGGTIEIEMPDLELCIWDFMNAPEDDKWNYYIWFIYGAQTDTDDNFSLPLKNGLKEYYPFTSGQVHTACLSLPKLRQIMEAIGFKIIDAYNYNGGAGGSSCLFIYAEKPK